MKYKGTFTFKKLTSGGYPSKHVCHVLQSEQGDDVVEHHTRILVPLGFDESPTIFKEVKRFKGVKLISGMYALKAETFFTLLEGVRMVNESNP